MCKLTVSQSTHNWREMAVITCNIMILFTFAELLINVTLSIDPWYYSHCNITPRKLTPGSNVEQARARICTHLKSDWLKEDVGNKGKCCSSPLCWSPVCILSTYHYRCIWFLFKYFFCHHFPVSFIYHVVCYFLSIFFFRSHQSYLKEYARRKNKLFFNFFFFYSRR